jgi:hypothetical protein
MQPAETLIVFVGRPVLPAAFSRPRYIARGSRQERLPHRVQTQCRTTRSLLKRGQTALSTPKAAPRIKYLRLGTE